MSSASQLRLAVAQRPLPAVVARGLDSRSHASVSSVPVYIARVVSAEDAAETHHSNHEEVTEQGELGVVTVPRHLRWRQMMLEKGRAPPTAILLTASALLIESFLAVRANLHRHSLPKALSTHTSTMAQSRLASLASHLTGTKTGLAAMYALSFSTSSAHVLTIPLQHHKEPRRCSHYPRHPNTSSQGQEGRLQRHRP